MKIIKRVWTNVDQSVTNYYYYYHGQTWTWSPKSATRFPDGDTLATFGSNLFLRNREGYLYKHLMNYDKNIELVDYEEAFHEERLGKNKFNDSCPATT